MALRLNLLAASTLLLAAPTAAQNAPDGERMVNQCRACHTVDQGGRNGVRPTLHRMFDRKAGSVSAVRYSAPMKARVKGGLTWADETLSAYLRTLREYMRGGSAGLRNDQQIADLIGCLRQATGAAR